LPDLGGWGGSVALALSRRQPEAACRRRHRERAAKDFSSAPFSWFRSSGTWPVAAGSGWSRWSRRG